MNTAIWIVQILLALVFLITGSLKLTQPKEKLVERMTWVKDTSPSIVKAIGIVEILGAVGLVLPTLTHILPILTPVAAVGLVLTMVGALATHLRYKEYSHVLVPVLLLALAVFVVYGRFVAVPL